VHTSNAGASRASTYQPTNQPVSLHCTEESSSLLWVLRRWALTYLGTQENYCQEISQDLYAAFGRETEGAAWSVNFLLDKVLGNLAHCGAEPGVVEDTVLLLVIPISRYVRLF
jgi:hypothetical protein